MSAGEREAVARLCRRYVAFLAEPDEDALFNWANALHSMHDRVPEAMKQELFQCPEFVALKALRNHFHHGAEISHRIKVLSVQGLPVVTDLSHLCLIDRAAAEAAVAGISPKHQARERPMAEAALKWYGPCVDVHPAIFNLMVQVVLLAQKHEIQPDDDTFENLAEAIKRDEDLGYPVTVSGDIRCHAGAVDEVLAAIMAT